MTRRTERCSRDGRRLVSGLEEVEVEVEVDAVRGEVGEKVIV